MMAELTHLSGLVGRRVLIVEDEFILAMDLQAILEEQGCNVLALARNVSQALMLLDENDPELVTLDLNLNGQSSAPVARVLKEKGIPFVVISGNDAKAAKSADYDDAPYLTKPLYAEKLIEVLGDLCK